MDISLKDTKLSLARDSLIAFRDGRGARITCIEGSLWVTQECSIKDEVLGPGQTLRVRHDGLTIVTALMPSALILSEDPSLAARLGGTLPARIAAMLRERLARWLGAPSVRVSASHRENRNAHWSGKRAVRAA
jgi:hypothetical protein